MKNSVYNLTRRDLEEYFISKGLPKYRALQVIEGVYRQRVHDFSEIVNLGKAVKAMLAADFVFGALERKEEHIAADGTTKFLFALEDGNLIETVLMRHPYGCSVCVTSQVGCRMGCAFCASGTAGKIRNLLPGEMVLQVLTIDNLLLPGEHVSRAVVMGSGEPFDNYDNVMKFIEIINDHKGMAIGSRHITVSTCGIVPKIGEFASFPLQVNLAVSLHFPNDELRRQYMPIARKYRLSELIEACIRYRMVTGRRLTFEYILLRGINDSLKQAAELVDLLKPLSCYVNLIPCNETEGHPFQRSDEKTANIFFDYLIRHGINAIFRKEHGREIAAACGQLRVRALKDEITKEKKNER